MLQWLLLAATAAVGSAQYQVEVLEPPRHSGSAIRRVVQRCDATGANFGSEVVTFTFSPQSIGCALSMNPLNACTNGRVPSSNQTFCMNRFAVVPRGNCSFSEKAYYAERAEGGGFQALIMFNDEGLNPIDMAGGKFQEQVDIPVIMVSYTCMTGMMERYTAADGFVVQIKLSPGYYDLFRYLIPFVVVIGFCFVVLVASLIIRICRERRRLSRKRLSRKHLRKIPTKKYRRGEQPDTCAICLDEFEEGEKVRVLPCRHLYHCKCIDPWLTKNRKVCPMCKRRVGAKNSDSESSGEEQRRRVVAARSHHREMALPSVSALPYSALEEDPSLSSQLDLAGTPTSSRAALTPSGSRNDVLVNVEVHPVTSSERLVQESTSGRGTDDAPVENGEAYSPATAGYMARLTGLFSRLGRRRDGRERIVDVDSDTEIEVVTDEIDSEAERQMGGIDNAAYETASMGRPTRRLVDESYDGDTDDDWAPRGSRSLPPTPFVPPIHVPPTEVPQTPPEDPV